MSNTSQLTLCFTSMRQFELREYVLHRARSRRGATNRNLLVSLVEQVGVHPDKTRFIKYSHKCSMVHPAFMQNGAYNGGKSPRTDVVLYKV
jgi:hypothetical protein